MFPAPQYIQFYPTLRCNQKCRFCFNDGIDQGTSASYGDISFEYALRLADIFDKCGTKEIDVMGGEPTLLTWMPDFIERVLEKGMRINISTNGSNPGMIKQFPMASDGDLRIGISLESADAERHNELTGSEHFRSGVESILNIFSLGIEPIVKTVVTKGSEYDLAAIVSFLRTTGVKQYYLIHMDCLSLSKSIVNEALGYQEFFERYLRIKSEHPDIDIHPVHASCFSKDVLPQGARCAGGVRKLAVMPDGSVFPCNLLVRFEDYRLGNIFTDSFRSIWENPVLDYFRNWKGEACSMSDCENVHFCTGGCPAHGLFHSGKPDGPDMRCRIKSFSGSSCNRVGKKSLKRYNSQ